MSENDLDFLSKLVVDDVIDVAPSILSDVPDGTRPKQIQLQQIDKDLRSSIERYQSFASNIREAIACLDRMIFAESERVAAEARRKLEEEALKAVVQPPVVETQHSVEHVKSESSQLSRELLQQPSTPTPSSSTTMDSDSSPRSQRKRRASIVEDEEPESKTKLMKKGLDSPDSHHTLRLRKVDSGSFKVASPKIEDSEAASSPAPVLVPGQKRRKLASDTSTPTAGKSAPSAATAGVSEEADKSSSKTEPQPALPAHAGKSVSSKTHPESRTNVHEEKNEQKLANQIPIATFMTFVDSYFRVITDEDLALIDPHKETDPEGYLIPPLGPNYLHVWAAEDDLDLSGRRTDSSSGSRLVKKEDDVGTVLDPFRHGNPAVVPEDVASIGSSLGSLSERLLASLVQENLIPKDVFLGDSSSDMSVESDAAPADLPTQQDLDQLERRIRQELYYIGLLDDESMEITEREDDELCAELRYLQRQLREQAGINKKRKSLLLDEVREYLPYQEFTRLMAEVNKQVEQAYVKRFKSGKKKKVPAEKKPVEMASRALHHRKEVLAKFGSQFPKEGFVAPKESIFAEQAIQK